jgi:hypothetical protein
MLIAMQVDGKLRRSWLFEASLWGFGTSHQHLTNWFHSGCDFQVFAGNVQLFKTLPPGFEQLVGGTEFFTARARGSASVKNLLSAWVCFGC